VARTFNTDDYVDVAERIRQFKEKYPKGVLKALHQPQLVLVGEQHFILYAAAAIPDPQDSEVYGVGYAWEPVPGRTPFTKDSELMNAETSAWGRAIIALGDFETKKIASANEVRNRDYTDLGVNADTNPTDANGEGLDSGGF
jgi:hypothetical protein